MTTPTFSVNNRVALPVSAHRLVHIYRVEGNDVVALSNVDLDVAAGEIVAILGPSGSGKSTLLTLLAGLEPPSAGRLSVGDRDLSAMSARQRDLLRATEVGIVVQGATRNLLPYASPAQNVALAQRAARRAGKELLDPEALLELLGLADVAHAAPESLTPAQLQIVAVAVAMSASPGLLLADEPTSQLDHHHRDAVLKALAEVNAAFGTTILIVTHDPAVADVAPRRITIRDGRVGQEARGAGDYTVVARDGTLQLPPEALVHIPAGSLVQLAVQPDGGVSLYRMNDNT